METESQADLNAPVSQEADVLDKKVGTLEVERLEAKEVTVKDISIETKKGSDKPVGKIVHVRCKHPDKDELIDITKVLYRKNEKESVKESGLWYNEDKEENIQKGSAVAVLLNYKKVTTLKELAGKEMATEPNEAGYLCFKAY